MNRLAISGKNIVTLDELRPTLDAVRARNNFGHGGEDLRATYHTRTHAQSCR